MADTRRSLSALQTLLADNTSGDISAQDARDVLVSVDGENAVQTAAYASEPATALKTGDLFLPSNGVWMERYSGSAWIPWGPIYPMTKPVSGDFAWVNQGGATVNQTYGPIYLECADNGGSYSTCIRKKAAPSTPYTITAAFKPVLDIAVSGFGFFGIGWRQASDGKLVRVGVENYTASNTALFLIQKFTDATSFSANYVSANSSTSFRDLIWLRIADDGSNRKVSVSADGQNWMQIHSVGRTDFMTADEVMFWVDPYSMGTGMSLLSWKEA